MSNTVIEGATGTGKTLLSLQFLMKGARDGETGAYFTLEETPDQLRAIATGLGWDLAALERKGRLSLNYTSPVELSTDRYLQAARDHVEKANVRRAVFDSLTSMSLGVPSERRFKELVYAITKHMRACGVTLVTTVEAQQLLGADEPTGRGVSFIADNLIRLRYLDRNGRLEHGISVLKARGIKHLTELRQLKIGSKGLRVVRTRTARKREVLPGATRGNRRRSR